MSQKQKTEKKKIKSRAKVGNNNGQLRSANANSCGAHKPPGPKFCVFVWVVVVETIFRASPLDLCFVPGPSLLKMLF